MIVASEFDAAISVCLYQRECIIYFAILTVRPNDRDDAQIRLRGLVRGERHASEDKRARPHVLVEVAHRQCIGLTLKIMLVGPW